MKIFSFCERFVLPVIALRMHLLSSVGNVGGGNMQISVRDDRGRPHFNRRDDHHKGSRNRDDGFRGGHNSNSRIPEVLAFYY